MYKVKYYSSVKFTHDFEYIESVMCATLAAVVEELLDHLDFKGEIYIDEVSNGWAYGSNDY